MALVLFAVAFGYLEAAIVVYLRSIYQPVRAELYPDRPSESLFPVITFDELKRRGWEHERQLYIELGRELSTLVMLAAVAWGACRSRREWFAMFSLMFGVWDICFYVFLRLLIGWPTSLWEWDILFLLPTIWTGPVIAPLLVSVGLIAGAVWLLVREAVGRPYRAPLWCWLGVLVGGLLIILAFCWDRRSVTAGEMPGPFQWGLFLLGLAGGFACFSYGGLRANETGD
jgi:hypothetical protein